jgi:transcriptional regulator with XRE-family HTH domain
MTPLRKRFGRRVKELRHACGLSQEAFADRCGFARSYMSRVERGGANPSLDAVDVLAQALGVEPSALFTDDAPDAAAGCGPLVPFARDGSHFSQSTCRPGTKEYNVGDRGRGNMKRFKDFDEALAYLRNMKPARWWRPNKNGDWALVTAMRWAPMPPPSGGGG